MNCIDDIEKILEELKMNSVRVLKDIQKAEFCRVGDSGLMIESGEEDKDEDIESNSNIKAVNYDKLLILFEEIVNELVNEIIIYKRLIESDSKVYILSNSQKMEISNELVISFSESLLNVNMIDVDSRNSKNEVKIDFNLKYLNEMVKYMKNENDIYELNSVKFDEFCRELIEMRIPFRMDIMNRLYNDFNEYSVGWKNRCLMVNGTEYRMKKYVKKEWRLNELQYMNEIERIYCEIDNRYESIISSFSNFLQDKNNDDEIRCKIDRKLLNSFLNEYTLNMSNRDVKLFLYPIYSSFLKESIINKKQYDRYLKDWLGNEYKWKLLYRASEHDYTGESFHEYCDDKGPTLVIIKSTEGWIFGGYTTQSWSGRCIYMSCKKTE